jgi:hypothetical protein
MVADFPSQYRVEAKIFRDEEYCLLGYNAVYPVESQSPFRRNILVPHSGLKKPGKIPAGKHVAS